VKSYKTLQGGYADK